MIVYRSPLDRQKYVAISYLESRDLHESPAFGVSLVGPCDVLAGTGNQYRMNLTFKKYIVSNIQLNHCDNGYKHLIHL